MQNPTQSSTIQETKKFRKLPAHYTGILIPFFLSFLMTFLISGILTFKNIGFVSDFFTRWISAWALSWGIALPISITLLPVVKKLVATLVEEPTASKGS